MLFDRFEAYDVQETRRISKEEGRLEGRVEGRIGEIIRLVCKKIEKKYSVPEIADMLEEEEGVIQQIYDIAVQFAPEYDVEKIYEKMKTE